MAAAPAGDPRSGLPRDVESVRVEVIAILLAFDRFSAPEIADALGIDAAIVEGVRDDLATAAMVNDLRAYLPPPGDVTALLKNDAEANVQWLRRMRDGFIKDDPKLLRVRQRAAEVLLDRQVPKKLAPVRIDTKGAKAIDVTPEQAGRMRLLMGMTTGSTDGAAE
jgi:hypothetical protein